MTIPAAIEHAELALHALRQAEQSAGTRRQQIEGAMRELVLALSEVVEAERRPEKPKEPDGLPCPGCCRPMARWSDAGRPGWRCACGFATTHCRSAGDAEQGAGRAQ